MRVVWRRAFQPYEGATVKQTLAATRPAFGGRRGVVVVAACAVGALALAGCGSSSKSSAGVSSSAPVVSVGSLTVVTVAPQDQLVQLGLKRGAFAAEGLDLKAIQTGNTSTSLAALVGGSADIFDGGGISTMTAAQKGDIKGKIIGSTKDGSNYLIVSKKYAADHGITQGSSPEDIIAKLKGATFGANNTTGILATIAKQLFATYGYDPAKDYKLQVIQDSNAIFAQFSQNRLDAFGYPPNLAFKAKNELGALIFPIKSFTKAPQFHDSLSQVTLVSDSVLASKPDAVKAFLRAEYKTWDWLVSNPADAKKLMNEIYPDRGTDTNDVAVDQLALGLYVTQKSWDATTQLFQIGNGKPLASSVTYAAYVPSFQDDVLGTLKLKNAVAKS
jgi:ABC-type nitrate/sulfonate/bicarbonate transport system substrate-binding protein